MGTIIFALGMTALFTPKIFKFMSCATGFDENLHKDVELDIDESEVEPIDPDLL